MQLEEIFSIEPRLKQIEQEILSIDSTCANYCADKLWYRSEFNPGFKSRMMKLAGWFAENPKLNTPETYNKIYDYLYNLLPHCNKCGC